MQLPVPAAVTISNLRITLFCFSVMPSVTSATIYNISWISTNPLHVDERAALDCRRPTKLVDSLVGTCTKANDSVIIRLREIPMLPNEMSYKPDHDYFFITTSTGEINGLENNEGGLCRTNNMRLKIRVESKPTGIRQRTSDITQRMNAGSVVMIPVDSGQYAVPLLYLPVAPSSNANGDDRKRPAFPYNLYFANGQLRATNSNLEELGPRAGVGTLSYPFASLLHMTGNDGTLKESRFDAGDQPKDFANPVASGTDVYIVPPKVQKEKEIDFEIEYVDSGSDGTYKNAKATGITAIIFCISTANILW